MIDSDFLIALDNPAWIQVLRAYYAVQQTPGCSGLDAVQQEASSAAAAVAEDAEMEPEGEESGRPRRTARWLARIHQIEGLAKDELSRIHGRLIAYGFLKCDLAERTAEVVYQLTLAGKQVLNLATNTMAISSEPGSEVVAAA